MYVIGTGAQRAGKKSRVLIGGIALSFASFRTDLTGDDYPTPNFNSYNAALGQSFDEGILGFIQSRPTFGGDWDAATNPLNSPPGLYPRDDLGFGIGGVSLIPNIIDAAASGVWLYPVMRVRAANSGTDVKGKVTFDCSAYNQGPFSWPTGNVGLTPG